MLRHVVIDMIDIIAMYLMFSKPADKDDGVGLSLVISFPEAIAGINRINKAVGACVAADLSLLIAALELSVPKSVCRSHLPMAYDLGLGSRSGLNHWLAPGE